MNINELRRNKMTVANIILLITATLTGLSAGLLFSYSCSVNLGLGRLGDSEYLSAMQSINKEILNPLFFVVFFGALVILPVSSYLNYTRPVSLRFLFLLIASLVYAIGVFGVTSFGNVPLNDALAKINLQSSPPLEISRLRTIFEKPWNRLHSIRTVASVISFVFVILACLNTSAVEAE
ncbi:MAG: anthrone oxygenase family protein [Ginsengibacter sp.]